LEQLHDASQDPIVGPVEVVEQQDAGTGLGWHPVRGSEVGRVSLNDRKTMKVTHLLELRRCDVCELPPVVASDIFDERRLSDPVNSPYADRGTVTIACGRV